MIPEQNTDLTQLEITTQPSLTYKLDVENKRITGQIDDKEAVMQAVMKILNTERYGYVIYNSEYGVELERLIGKDYDFIISDIERTISEAILADDRMVSITDFTAEKIGINNLMVTFTVNTVFGSDRINVEVQVL